jgi:outer membrane biosynthesis protein TonB
MAVKDKSIREAQIASYGDAVAKRYAFLKEKGSERSVIEKDPILRHLKAELSRRRKRLLAAAPKPKPKPAPVVEKPPKEEEKPKEKPKKKEKTKKPATAESKEE